MLAGSFGLSEFTDIRVKKREERARQLTVEECELFKKKKKVVSLENMLSVSLSPFCIQCKLSLLIKKK